MSVEYYDEFDYEWSNACYKLNPTEENKARFLEAKKNRRKKNKLSGGAKVE